MAATEGIQTVPAPDEARAIRIKAGISQEKLAARIGCSTRTLLNWEWGRVSPNPLMRPKYARVLSELRQATDAR